MNYSKSFLFLFLITTLLALPLGVFAQEEPTQEATAQATAAEQDPPTETAAPTDTPAPTATNTPVPTPTSTPAPTDTLPPTSTSTPAVTATPIPATPTPTVTPIWPTDTPTRLPTLTSTSPAPTATCSDPKEPNDQPGSGPALAINQSVQNLTLHPFGDVDYFLLWGKAGVFYNVTTTTSQGVDTRLRIFDPAGSFITENDDYQVGSPASQASFQAGSEGWFTVLVDSRVPASWDCRQYSLTAVDVSGPTSTPTRTPGPPPTATLAATAIPAELMFDQYEPNYDFSTAANIGVGQTINLNFNPWSAGSNDVDNDFFRLYAKAGERLRFETTGLAEGLDTNLILYREDGQVIAGNDDCQAGQRASCLEWAPDANGVVYVLVGPVGTIPEIVASGSRAYNLVIQDTAGQTSSTGAAGEGLIPTPGYGQTPQLGLPWAVTPLPPTPAPGVAATPPGLVPFGTPTPAIQVRSISLPGVPTPTLPPMQLVTLGVSIYYDENNNKAPDVSEGVSGVSIRVLDGSTNNILGQAFTGSQGYAALTVTAVDQVRLSVPYLGYNENVRPPGKEVTIRLTPLRLPSLIP